MEMRKILQIGTNIGIALPQSLVRELGWLRGDYVGIFTKGGDVVLRNDTKRATRFTHVRAGRADQLAGTAER